MLFCSGRGWRGCDSGTELCFCFFGGGEKKHSEILFHTLGVQILDSFYIE